MTPFLQSIAQYISDNYRQSTEKLCVVLPNKRGALYLKQHLAKVFNKTIWLPTIISAEDLVAELSGLAAIDSIELTCALYEAYCQVLRDKAEPFDAFAKWGSLMLQDFNEADRYLVDTQALYQNLKEIREIENWSLAADTLTDTQNDYVQFMSQMGEIYKVFCSQLLERRVGYQGLMYRKAVEHYASSPYLASFDKLLVCGFNALNKAETIIFSDLVAQQKAEIIWDADHYYTENEANEAGLFLRKNFRMPAFRHRPFIGNDFRDINRQIDIVAVPRQVGQAQVAAQQLRQWIAECKSPDKTAIVLADESMLFPLLSQLPEEIEHVNITMEYPVRLTPVYDLAESLINLHHSIQKPGASKNYYYLDVLRVLHNTFFSRYYAACYRYTELQAVIQKIIEKNYAWLSAATLRELFAGDHELMAPLLTAWPDSNTGIRAIYSILQAFNGKASGLSSLEQEYVFVFTKYFNRLKTLVEEHPFLGSLSTLRAMFRQVVGSATIPFIGEPLKGLQIMGVLETRTLDFENILLLGVNEGVLPSGKSNNSFIPNDLKRYHGMPLYGDKDAIYAYHFYRLLQRAENIVLTYNTEHSVLGSGEKSRFITQLQFELQAYNPNTRIRERIMGGTELPASGRIPIGIHKTSESLAPVLQKLTTNNDYSGLSPSAIIMHKDCPLRFYFRYGAGIRETIEVEETAEANTFGSILHQSLEMLYLPHVGKVLKAEDVEAAMRQKEESVNAAFRHHFTQNEARFGKNFLQLNVLYVYVGKLLKQDLELIRAQAKQNHYLSLVALEKKLQATIEVEVGGTMHTVYIRGSADRIDRLGPQVRIIDYKSSIQSKDKFGFTGFDDLFGDTAYNKMLQLFIYAWLAVKNNIARPEELLPCIIPFKKFEEEPRFIHEGKQKQPLVFTQALLNDFESSLAGYIRGIANREIPFTQTEDLDQCRYCAYAAICNIPL